MVTAVPAPGPADIERWRKLCPPQAVTAAMRVASGRIRGKPRFTRADRMWLDPVGLEQATSEVVARYKAARFVCELAVDLCAGIGGDALALASRCPVLAVDMDLGRCRRLGWNAEVYEVAHNLLVCQARAEASSIPQGAWAHIDPDRRTASASRARSLTGYVPGLSFLKSLIRKVPGGAMKLGPASDFEDHFNFSIPGLELELISLDGECKEATVWFGAAATCHRRATRLPENATWTDRDGPPPPGGLVRVIPVAAYVYDPDPALIRSGLLDAFADAHSLKRIAADIAYLTADHLVETPLLSAFAVESVHPLDLRQLKRLVAARSLGPLEIKVRGVEMTPEKLRSRLHPPGPNPATLILAGGAGEVRVMLSQRLPKPRGNKE